MPSFQLSLRTARRLGTILTIACLAMAAAALLLLIPNMALPSFVPLGFFGIAGFVLAVAFPTVGWLILSRGPANLIGWLLLLVGASQAVDTISQQYATYVLLGHPATLPLADVAAWLYSWVYFPGLLLFLLAILLFPDGHLPSPRWRPVLWAIAATALVILPPASIATWPFRGVTLLAAQLPAGMYSANALLGLLWLGGNVLIPLVALSTLLGVVMRFRRSQGLERLQLKWFALGSLLTIGALLAFSLSFLIIKGGIPAPFDGIAGVMEGAVLPIAIGIAVLRYRLYDIDLVIRRTLVYVPLTALLAGVYAASIGLSQRAFIAIVGKESDGAVIISTLILAATFTPIKNAIQGRVDRGFRDAHDAERRLLAFTQAVQDQLAVPDPARTMRAFLGTAIGAVKAGGGEAWLETDAGEQFVGATAARTDGPSIVIPVEAGGRQLGRLALDGRAGGGAYSPRDLAALHLAAEHLALALSGLQMSSPVEPSALASLPSPTVDSAE